MPQKIIPRANQYFYAGLSDDRFVGPDATFYSSENVNVIEEPKAIKLSTKIEDYHAQTYTGNITKILPLPSGNVLIFTDKGEIAFQGATVAHTITGTPVIHNAEVFGENVLIFTEGKVHKVAFSGYFTGTLTVTDNLFTFTSGDTRDCYIPVYNSSDNFLYFASSRYLYRIDISLVGVTTETTLEAGAQIVGIFFFEDRLKLYVNKNKSDCFIMAYSTLEDGSSSSFYYKGKLFKSVVSDGRMEYVNIADSIFASSGVSLTLIKKDIGAFTYSGTWASGNPHPTTAMAVRDDVVYILADYGIITVGNYHTGYPKATYKERTTTYKPTSISFLPQITEIYIGGSKKLKKIASGYQATGNIISRAFYASGIYQDKDIRGIFVGYDIVLGSGDSIDIYMNPNDKYKSFTVSGVSIAPSVGAVYSNNSSQYTVVEVKLTAGVGEIKTVRTSGQTEPSGSLLTYVSGTGDPLITFTGSSYFSKIGTITDPNKKAHEFYGNEYQGEFNFISRAITLNSSTGTSTPRVFEITPFFTNKDL